MKLDSAETILFIGDSITDAGRRAADAPLGHGYVSLFATLLDLHHRDRRIAVVNKGISGDVVTGLRDRWSDDVIRQQPDWLSIKIGINDADGTLRASPDSVPPSLYRDTYHSILSRTRDALPECKLLLIDPFYISTEAAPGSFRTEVLKLLPEYLQIVDELSEAFGTLHVQTHQLFQRLLATQDPETFCPEPIHPHLAGHLVIADAVYQALSGE